MPNQRPWYRHRAKHGHSPPLHDRSVGGRATSQSSEEHAAADAPLDEEVCLGHDLLNALLLGLWGNFVSGLIEWNGTHILFLFFVVDWFRCLTKVILGDLDFRVVLKCVMKYKNSTFFWWSICVLVFFHFAIFSSSLISALLLTSSFLLLFFFFFVSPLKHTSTIKH